MKWQNILAHGIAMGGLVGNVVLYSSYIHHHAFPWRCHKLWYLALLGHCLIENILSKYVALQGPDILARATPWVSCNSEFVNPARVQYVLKVIC